MRCVIVAGTDVVPTSIASNVPVEIVRLNVLMFIVDEALSIVVEETPLPNWTFMNALPPGMVLHAKDVSVVVLKYGL